MTFYSSVDRANCKTFHGREGLKKHYTLGLLAEVRMGRGF